MHSDCVYWEKLFPCLCAYLRKGPVHCQDDECVHWLKLFLFVRLSEKQGKEHIYENYIALKETQFTHQICPACLLCF